MRYQHDLKRGEFAGAIKRRAKLAVKALRAPWVTGSTIRNDTERLGVMAGDTLLVHSSLSSLGFVVGGQSTVIRELMAVLGPNGTLVMPTHSWEAAEHGNRLFNVRNTPSCVGAISEAFRRMPGVRRSLHPTHSVAAIGRHALDIIEGHEHCETPCGYKSPYWKILAAGGGVLFIGVGLESNTAYHTAEALASVPYLLMDSPDVFEVIDENAKSRNIRIRRHRAGIPRRFRELESDLASASVVRIGTIGTTRCLLLKGKEFLDRMNEILGKDPNYLLATERK